VHNDEKIISGTQKKVGIDVSIFENVTHDKDDLSSKGKMLSYLITSIGINAS
jgi:hypothetical protein